MLLVFWQWKSVIVAVKLLRDFGRELKFGIVASILPMAIVSMPFTFH
jgi:hypothetical protein